VSITQAADVVRTAQAAGESVVMCHGCFDIVHPGHVRHLQHAARLGDRLLVTVTGDGLMRKGENRPLIPQELRAENLAALDCVDWVAINNRPTASEILEELRPNIYVKGREYEHNRDPRFLQEKTIVERHGGRVVFTSGDVVFSSTALIQAMEDAASPFHATLRQIIDSVARASRPCESENGRDARSTAIDLFDALIERFRGRRVVVIGEAIRDTYVMCERPAVAGESPIMTLRPLEYRSFDGGAAIIARHIAAMGGEATLLTVLPRSTEAEALRRRLNAEHVEVKWIDNDSALIEKQRFLVGASKVMKLDLGGPITLDATDQETFIELALEAAGAGVGGCDAAIIGDFGQGLFTGAMLTRLCERVRECVPVMTGDVSGRRSNLLAMRKMDLLCPSEAEIRDALHDYDEGLSSVTWRVLDMTESKAAIATLGEEGLIAFDRRADADENPEGWQTRLDAQHVPALSPYAVDQLGCGDALLAAATLTLASGAARGGLAGTGGGLVQAALLGSVAAACQAQRLGNAVIGAADLRRGVRRLCEAQLAWQDDETTISVNVRAAEAIGHHHHAPHHAQLRPAHAQST
jgi:rfaE bifunctional protein nucleotidyltransferase chain/domain